MKISVFRQSAPAFLAAAIALNACSANGIQPQAGTFQMLSGRRSAARLDANGNPAKVGFWVTNQLQNYLLGQSQNGKQTLVAIDTGQVDCYAPTGLKIDGAQNVWVACLSDVGVGTNASRVLEYDKSGKLLTSLPWTPCPSSAATCFTEGWDAGFDSKGNIFASVQIASYPVTKNGSTQYVAETGFEWWKTPASKPKFISTGNACSPACAIYYMDVDDVGNIWFDYFGQGAEGSGYSLGEVIDPTTNPKVIFPLPIGTYGAANGVYASDGGRILNVTDAGGVVYRYHLPVTSKSKPFKTLGPTAASRITGGRDPVSGGFNKDDSSMVLADGLGWLDVGTLSGNKWHRLQSPGGAFGGVIQSASFTPSDKTSTP